MLLVLLLLWLPGCGEPRRVVSAGSAAGSAMAVSVVPAAMEAWPSAYEATGTVHARSTAVIAAKWMGYVREVKVQTGDLVQAGQLLVVLDSRDLDASSRRASAGQQEVRNSIPEAESAVAAAKANLALAEATFRRMNELYEKKSISDQEFDEASAKLKGAQAAFEMARAKRTQLDAKLAQAAEEVQASEVTRSYAEIRAPFAGLVTTKSVEPGNLATPGAPLLTIEGGGYRLEASVEESRLGSVRTGQAVTVTLDDLERRFAARVSEIVPTVDAASRAYTVKIDLPAEPAIRSGMFGRASFSLGSREVLAIPAGAVSERGQVQSVFVADNGVARTRLITLGERAGGRIAVLSGMNPGEAVIFPVPQSLADGARIEAKP